MPLVAIVRLSVLVQSEEGVKQIIEKGHVVSERWGRSAQVAIRLFGLVLEEGDQVVTVLGLLETAEGHLGTRNVLLGVLEVLELWRC
jgi:hypothetical protein